MKRLGASQRTSVFVLMSPQTKHPASFAFANRPAAKLKAPLAVLSAPGDRRGIAARRCRVAADDRRRQAARRIR